MSLHLPTGLLNRRLARANIRPWEPMDWQRAPFGNITHDVILLSGSAGGGKSAVMLAKAHRFCQVFPKAFVLAVRKTRASMTAGTAMFLEQTIVQGQARHHRGSSMFIYPNGSMLAYRGMANQVEATKIRSIGPAGNVDMVVVDEATEIREEVYDELLARLRGMAAPWRQIIMATNPDSPHHWIYKRFVGRDQAGLDKEGAIIYYSGARDNKYLPPDYQDKLELIPGHMGQRLARGEWVSAKGLVHTNFDAEKNVIPDFHVPDSWKRVGSIDFGFSVCCAQWWAVDPDGRMYLYREVYQKGLLPHDLAELIKSFDDFKKVRWVADHQSTERAILAQHGVSTAAANKGVERGLQVVNAKLRPDADGKPMMLLMDSALLSEDSRLARSHLPTRTEQEFTMYSWAEKADGTPTDKPVKVNDHGMDAARYAAVYLDSLPKFTFVGG